MYILFFGGFILFLDCINFVMNLKKKKKRRSTSENIIMRYVHACDERSGFVKFNHFLAIGGIFISILVQLLSCFPFSANSALLECLTLFLISLLFYLAGYQVVRAIYIHYKDSNNTVVKIIFFLVFLFVIFVIAGIEIYILIASLSNL